MKKQLICLGLSALVLSACSGTTASIDDQLAQKDHIIAELQEELKTKDDVLEEKNELIKEQNKVIQNQHERIKDMLEQSGTFENDDALDDYVQQDRVSLNTVSDMVPVSPMGTTYEESEGSQVNFRYDEGAGNSKMVIEESDANKEIPYSREEVKSTKTCSMEKIPPYPMIDDLSGQEKEWAQKIYDAMVAGQGSIDIDPVFFGVDNGSLTSDVASRIEKAVFFSLYPMCSYFTNGMVYLNGYGHTDPSTGKFVDFTLYLRSYKTAYAEVIRTWVQLINKNVNSSTSELDAYQLFHDQVCAYLEYDPSALHNSLTTVIQSGRGVCNDYAEMVCTLCRSVGIEAKYVIGYQDGNYHAWVQVNLDGKWYYSDPTNDDQSYGIITNFYLSENLWPGYEVTEVI